jgi:hypothetical protein
MRTGDEEGFHSSDHFLLWFAFWYEAFGHRVYRSIGSPAVDPVFRVADAGRVVFRLLRKEYKNVSG